MSLSKNFSWIPSMGSRCANRYLSLSIILLLTLPVATSSRADDFVFDIEYFGDDVAQLAPGSDEPDGTSLNPGDTFQWTIASADSRFWLVETGGDFFPLMAFSVNPSGVRTGDFELVLRKDGADVFSFGATDEVTLEVHLGTNTISLPTGLMFDEMFLDYTLNSAVETSPPADPVSTTISGRLPIFGAPENNLFASGIVFIPEPATAVLLMIAGGLMTSRRVPR